MFNAYREVLVIAGLVFCLFSSAFAYSGGSGTQQAPYQIADANDLLQLAATTSDYNKCFILTADIDMEGQVFTTAIIAGDTIAGNYSFEGAAFTGTFDGNNHKITNSTINGGSNDYLGLFGYLFDSGSVKNLGLENCSVSGDSNSYFVGGLVGRNDGSISNCYSTGSVSGRSVVGGLVGYNEDGSIANCYSMAEVSSNGGAGGLVSSNNGHIANCYSTGAVSGNIYGVGGLVGENSWLGDITKCYSTGAVSGGGDIGGLVGRNEEDGLVTISFWDVETSSLTISDGGNGLSTEEMKHMTIYSLKDWAGNDWTIDDGNEYPRLAWENAVGQPIAEPNVPLNGSGTAECPYEIRNAQDLQLLSFACALWDKHFVLINDIDVNNYNIEPIGYDIRREELYGGYVIYYGLEYQFQGVLNGNGHVISNLIIDANDMEYVGLFRYIGSNAIIKNLGIEDANIIGGSYVGSLVGLNNGSVNNSYSTGIVNSNGSYVGGLVGENYGGNISASYNTTEVSGEQSCCGGLAGYNDGDILNCYNTGIVNGSDCVGGLIGWNDDGWNDDHRVENCYNAGTVGGDNYSVGGLAGSNGGYIINCYNIGSVVGGSSVGGLVGENYIWQDSFGLLTISPGSITNCYSTGDVDGDSPVGGLVGDDSYGSYGIAEQSFWDVNTSGQTESAGGEGKTTEEMQTLSTFTSAGWDFSYTDGDPADWFIQIEEYPILVWQISPADIYTDGRNNFRDFAVFAQYWMRDDCAIYNYYCDWADLNFDGSVDIDDLIVLMSYWLQSGIYE